MPQVSIALAACPLGYERPLSVNTKSNPECGLVRPNNNFDTPTDRFKSISESRDKLNGRHVLNLRPIKMEVSIKIIAVTLRNPKSSTNITKVGVLPGVTSKISRL
jgi:hypothetical protein